MLTDYIQAAMRRAHYELLDDQPDEPYVGTIPDLQGVMAIGSTLEACREDLQSALEEWLLVGMWLGHTIPPIGGIDINRPHAPLQPVSEAA